MIIQQSLPSSANYTFKFVISLITGGIWLPDNVVVVAGFGTVWGGRDWRLGGAVMCNLNNNRYTRECENVTMCCVHFRYSRGVDFCAEKFVQNVSSESIKDNIIVLVRIVNYEHLSSWKLYFEIIWKCFRRSIIIGYELCWFRKYCVIFCKMKYVVKCRVCSVFWNFKNKVRNLFSKISKNIVIACS